MKHEEKKEHLLHSLNGIDPRFVEEAAEGIPSVKKTTPRLWLMRTAVAACVCAVLAMGIIGMINQRKGDAPNIDGSTSSTTAGDVQTELGSDGHQQIHAVFPWKDSKHLMGIENFTSIHSDQLVEDGVLVKSAVAEITEGKYAAYVAGHVIDADHVGELLERVTVKSYWKWSISPPPNKDREEDVTYIGAEVYAIKDVVPEAAVCVRYLEQGVATTTTHYYIYSNPNWTGDSLEAFFEAFDAETHLSLYQNQSFLFSREDEKEINGTVSNGEDQAEVRLRLTLSDADREVLRAMLLECKGEAKAIANVEALDAYIAEGTRQAQLFVRMNSYANRLLCIQIFSNGYLMVCGNGSPMLFEIGEESANAIIERMGACVWTPMPIVS